MSICAGITYELKKLNNIFIEMTSKNCNQRCSSCYIDFPVNKNIKDFISTDKIKEGLTDTRDEELHCIYLSGAEPMTHPDFNTILRMCLKRCNVCICTNGSFLNEKKIRFLKKVEDENNTQIFFKLTLAHYNEYENDTVRYRGNYRQVISALKNLSRYNFTSVVSVQNYYNLDKKEIIQNFKEIFTKQDIINADIQINVSYPVDTENISISRKTDCMYGRVLSQNGIYSCPFLANDYRGRCGCSFKNYSKTTNAETDFCISCSANQNPVFMIG